jgi:predicted acyl esterase
MRRVLALLTAIATFAFAAAADAHVHYIPATFTARGSVNQVYATGVRPGALLVLVDRHGSLVSSGRADSLGGILFRLVPSGRGYRLLEQTSHGTMRSGALTVLPDRSAPPGRSIYNQTIGATSGYGYLTTRDGTKLAIDVRLPFAGGPPPYPTLIEYAGYGYADPGGPDSGIASIARLLGYAVVDVNMRGTGCSGGAFDYFEPLQSLDGYDVIETIARQSWVLGHRVGMLGISYGGISQLFVAATRPPHLAAITPLSVIDSSITTLYPGGILNTGFALHWASERDYDALPASPTTGQSWAYTQIKNGDTTCQANQALHGEAVNTVANIYANSHYVPAVADPLDPITFVHKIDVPTYLACQWTDEQTGGHCADLAEHFTGTRWKWFTFDNGDHIDSLDPVTLTRMFDFLELYLARRAPALAPVPKALSHLIWTTAMGIDGLTFPPDPIQGMSSYTAALAAFQALPSVRVLFDNGAGGSPFYPIPAFEQSFARFPIPGTQARSWYLAPGGLLTASKPHKLTVNRFTWDKAARPATSFAGTNTSGGPGGLWGSTPDYAWTENPSGTAVSYVTAPLTANTVAIGAGAVQLWIKASVPDVDLQVTVSEVRPDGMETFVQDGWLRASDRELDPSKSTLLEPVPSLRAMDVAPLPHGRWTEITIPLYYEGHVYRKGSRIRIVIAAPNGDQAVWSFSQTHPNGGHAKVWVAFSRSMPSRLILPIVLGVAVPTALPQCPALRGEPCREYRPAANG